MRSDAMFSEDRRFRYWLLREWDETLPKCAFIGLNPSKADETVNDPTVTRCINYAKAWGKGGLLMLNVYAFRATLPSDMKMAFQKGTDIIGGPRNYVPALVGYCSNFQCDLIVAAWGNHAKARGAYVAAEWKNNPILIPLHCLGRNKDGSPKHPLYLKGDLKPELL